MEIAQIATKEDIANVLKAIAQLQSSIENVPKEQKYLRSSDVRKLLNISDGTLQRLRITKTLKAKKVNGTWFYSLTDVKKMMQ